MCAQALQPDLTSSVEDTHPCSVTDGEEQGNSTASSSEEGSILHEGTDFSETPCFTSHLMLQLFCFSSPENGSHTHCAANMCHTESSFQNYSRSLLTSIACSVAEHREFFQNNSPFMSPQTEFFMCAQVSRAPPPRLLARMLKDKIPTRPRLLEQHRDRA